MAESLRHTESESPEVEAKIRSSLSLSLSLPRSRAPTRAEQQLLLPPWRLLPCTVPLQAAMSHDLSKMTSTLMSPQPECVFIIFFVSFIQMFRIQQMLFSKPALLFLCVFLKHQGTGGGGWGGASRRGGSTCCPELLLRLMSAFLAEAAFRPAQASHCLPVSSWPAQSPSVRGTASGRLS